VPVSLLCRSSGKMPFRELVCSFRCLTTGTRTFIVTEKEIVAGSVSTGGGDGIDFCRGIGLESLNQKPISCHSLTAAGVTFTTLITSWRGSTSMRLIPDLNRAIETILVWEVLLHPCGGL